MSAWGKANQVQNNEIVSINCVEFISGSWPSSSSIRHVRYILTRAPRIALPVGPRCQVLQEHWLGRQCFRSHRSLRHCYRPRKGPICGYRDREGCCQGMLPQLYCILLYYRGWAANLDPRNRAPTPFWRPCRNCGENQCLISECNLPNRIQTELRAAPCSRGTSHKLYWLVRQRTVVTVVQCTSRL
jgi:hypothetical protein